MKTEAKKKSNVSAFEIVAYVVSGLIALWGLVYVVLGLLAKYLNVPSSKNDFLAGDNIIKAKFGLGFFKWGLVLLAIGAVVAVIVLVANARKSDREVEREARRAARRSRLEQELAPANETPAEEVVVQSEEPVEVPAPAPEVSE